MSSYETTYENLMRTLPFVLANDKELLPLAQVGAEALAAVATRQKSIILYPNIDVWSEELLDIIAIDFKVDWYSFDFSIEAKRSIIKNCIYIHRRKGTRRSVEVAMSDLYPGTQVTEWFEYGGKPYHFRVVLDVTEQRETVLIPDLFRILNLFKSLRSVMEDDAFYIRSRFNIEIKLTCGYAHYTVRLCGTYPSPAVQGKITPNIILVDEDGNSITFTMPPTGTLYAGTFPDAAVKGGILDSLIIIGSDEFSAAYSTVPTGTTYAGTVPDSAVKGGTSADIILLSTDEAAAVFTAPLAGTVPNPAEQGKTSVDTVTVSIDGSNAAYTTPAAGTIPNPVEQGGTYSQTITVDTDEFKITYAVPPAGTTKAGTVPDAATKGAADSGGLIFDFEVESLNFTTPLCGTGFDSI